MIHLLIFVKYDFDAYPRTHLYEGFDVQIYIFYQHSEVACKFTIIYYCRNFFRYVLIHCCKCQGDFATTILANTPFPFFVL